MLATVLLRSVTAPWLYTAPPRPKVPGAWLPDSVLVSKVMVVPVPPNTAPPPSSAAARPPVNVAVEKSTSVPVPETVKPRFVPPPWVAVLVSPSALMSMVMPSGPPAMVRSPVIAMLPAAPRRVVPPASASAKRMVCAPATLLASATASRSEVRPSVASTTSASVVTRMFEEAGPSTAPRSPTRPPVTASTRAWPSASVPGAAESVPPSIAGLFRRGLSPTVGSGVVPWARPARTVWPCTVSGAVAAKTRSGVTPGSPPTRLVTRVSVPPGMEMSLPIPPALLPRMRLLVRLVAPSPDRPPPGPKSGLVTPAAVSVAVLPVIVLLVMESVAPPLPAVPPPAAPAPSTWLSTTVVLRRVSETAEAVRKVPPP